MRATLQEIKVELRRRLIWVGSMVGARVLLPVPAIFLPVATL
jgi:hypothetical protein